MNTSNIPKCPGVYRIYVDNKSYIGASFNLKSRLQKHISYLNNQCHSNNHLQRAFDKYELKIEVLKTFESIDKDTLLDYETYYHIHFDSIENGFNVGLPRKIQSKFTLTDNQIKKATLKKTKKVYAFDRYTGELIKKFNSISEAADYFNGSTSNISQVCKNKLNHSYGCVFCYEKQYDSNKNYTFPYDHKKGVPHTKDHIEKLKKNHGRAKPVYKYDLNWNLIKKYYSISECERDNDIKKEGLRYKLDKKTPLGEYYYVTKVKDIV